MRSKVIIAAIVALVLQSCSDDMSSANGTDQIELYVIAYGAFEPGAGATRRWIPIANLDAWIDEDTSVQRTFASDQEYFRSAYAFHIREVDGQVELLVEEGPVNQIVLLDVRFITHEDRFGREGIAVDISESPDAGRAEQFINAKSRQFVAVVVGGQVFAHCSSLNRVQSYIQIYPQQDLQGIQDALGSR